MPQPARARFARLLALAGILAALASPAAAQRGRQQQAVEEPEPLAVHTQARIAQIFEQLESGGEIKPAIAEAQAIFDEAIAYAPLDRPQAIRDAALALRLLQQLDATTSVARGPILRYLREHGDLAASLAFLVTEHDEPDRVYWRLSRIVDAFPDDAAANPALTAAVCVVNEGPVDRPKGPQALLDPVQVFDYFRDIPGAPVDYKALPPELLVYLVNTRATPEELEWARMHADRNTNLGAYYAEIEYDYGSLRGTSEAKIAGKPYTLPNIQLHGGVCVDQAYYAEHIGKALGVPSVTSVGRGGVMGHAWIGFLRRGGRTGYRWDFTEARWSDYTDVRGTVIEPHTGLEISEAAVQLTLNLIDVDRANVEVAVALTDAVRRLDELAGVRQYPPRSPAIEGVTLPEQRHATLETRLELLEAALTLAPGRRDIWATIVPLAESGEMPHEQKQRWAEALLGYVDAEQHDFVIEILKPMFHTEPPERQVELWQWAEQQFRRRPDLACQSLIEQARALAAMGDRHAAFRTLEGAATRFANNTPWAVTAVFEAETMLKEAGGKAHEEVIPLYARVFRRIRRPSGGVSEAFMGGSTYIQIGSRYRDLLAAAGNQRMADRIDSELAAAVRRPDE